MVSVCLPSDALGGGSVVKKSLASAGDAGWEDPLKKEMATHCSMLAWEIQWAEETGGLQFMGSQRIGHDLATKHE